MADGSLGAADLAVGVVPADGYILQAMNVATDPAAAPDSPAVISPVLHAAARRHRARADVRRAVREPICSSGSPSAGLYIDNVAVPGTAPSAAERGRAGSAIELVASRPLAQGAHTLQYGIDCPTGTNTGSAVINATWTVMLAAE